MLAGDFTAAAQARSPGGHKPGDSSSWQTAGGHGSQGCHSASRSRITQRSGEGAPRGFGSNAYEQSRILPTPPSQITSLVDTINHCCKEDPERATV